MRTSSERDTDLLPFHSLKDAQRRYEESLPMMRRCAAQRWTEQPVS